MRLHVERVVGETRTIAIAIDDPHATVHDLAVALGLGSADNIWIDGHLIAASTKLNESGLVDGSSVSTLGPPSPAAERIVDGHHLRVGVESGPDSGYARPLSPGSTTIGRSPANDVSLANDTVSAEHAAITLEAMASGSHSITIDDLDSHNGTWIGDRSIHAPTEVEFCTSIRMGSSNLRIDVPTVDDRPMGVGAAHADAGGHILFNRPPRGPMPERPAPIRVPAARPERRGPTFSLVALAVPIGFAFVMIQVTGRWQYALFALLSPVMFLGTYLSGRRRTRRDRADDDEEHAAGLERLQRELGDAVEIERSHRRALAPDLLEVRRRVEVPSSRLWERRHGDVDALTVGLGRGDVPWQPALEGQAARDDDDHEVEAIIDAHRTLPDAAMVADFRNGPVGLVGETAACAGTARALVLQLAAHHGPSDLSIAVLTTENRLESWEWAQWLPHTAGGGGGVNVLAAGAAESFASRLVELLPPADGAQSDRSHPLDPGWLVVVESADLLHGRSSPTRALLRATPHHVFGLVLADSVDQLPASTATIAQVDEEGTLTLRAAGSSQQPAAGVADQTTIHTALTIARSLARFEDPELRQFGGALPAAVRPSDVWGEVLDSPHSIQRRWAKASGSERIGATIGIGADGPFTVDLVADGPHGLVAGTTGAGKSELLRTLVIGTALAHGPYDVVFVLIDYKGGSAFDRCADLPHVVGMVTDLDDHLAERALESLEAELRYREQLLRDAGTSDIAAYRDEDSPRGPLPRLVVIVDEFATLRSELPDFVSALVGIAQRGRSLGVHLILATQRPSGAVDANIRANTNLRVALRVQDTADSQDVIDSNDAALIDRSTPGRAFVRRGQGDLVAVQSAFVSGGRATAIEVPLRTAPTSVGTGAAPRLPELESASDVSELDSLVETVRAAADGYPTPRRPWLDDLPAEFSPGAVDGLESGDGAPVVLAVGDDPERQRRVTTGWNPSDGHLVAYGVLGSGVTTLLRSAIHRLASGVAGRPVWVFAADHGAGGLRGVEDLPHVSCRLEPTDDARHGRLLTMLAEFLDTRRDLPTAEVESLPVIVLVVDGLAGFCELTDTGNAGSNAERFNRIVRDGPAVGIFVIAGVNRAGEVPRSLAAAVRQHVIMELADPGDYQALGIRSRNLPAFRPGRALVGSKPMVTQVIDWSTHVDGAQAAVGSPPPRVEKLPVAVALTELDSVATVATDLSIPIGVDDASRTPAMLVIRGGEHALIAGPSGSGRTTALAAIGKQLRIADPDLVIVGLSPRPEADLFDADVLDAAGTIESLHDVLEMAKIDDRRWIVLVDDADQIDCDEGPLVDIARNARTGLNVIAAGRSSTVRQAYGHWLRHVRSAGTGVILNPDNGVDGEVLAIRLPRGVRLPEVPGRGYLVRNGEAQVVQLAT